MQSQSYFGPDSEIDAVLMRHFDRTIVQPSVALTTAPGPTPALDAVTQVRAIPRLRVRPTYFGPSMFGVRGLERARRSAAAPLTAASLLSLAGYIRHHRIQVIHGTEKPRDAFYGVLLGRLTGAKSVVHLTIKPADWLSVQVKWALRHADAIVGVSGYIAQTAVEAGYPAERVHSVWNSLDLSSGRWDPSLDGRPVRRELGIADGAPVIGIVARLFSWKGHTALIDALAVVRRELPGVRLVVVGDDDPRAHPGGGSYRAELEAQICRLGLQQHVIFTGLRTDIPELMAALDVFAMPTWEEPFGMVFLEAMAMKKPVVAWASGGATEIVMDGVTGFLVEPKATVALADALTRLLRDEQLRHRFGLEGRRRVEQVFTPRRMCQRMSDIYQAILARRGGAPTAGESGSSHVA
jgi:glycosyltransferase involved in cell wall biosynthesis